MIDQTGKRFTDKDLLGRFALLYFGFTWCPDICPEELQKIAAATDLTGGDPSHLGGHSCDEHCSIAQSPSAPPHVADGEPRPHPAEKLSGVQVVPVFLSLDPQRDGVEQVRDYVKEFHPRMVGLTGPYERVAEAAKAYRVYFSKTQDSEDDYLVDHSIITYLVNPEVGAAQPCGSLHSALQPLTQRCCLCRVSRASS